MDVYAPEKMIWPDLDLLILCFWIPDNSHFWIVNLLHMIDMQECEGY